MSRMCQLRSVLLSECFSVTTDTTESDLIRTERLAKQLTSLSYKADIGSHPFAINVKQLKAVNMVLNVRRNHEAY